MKKLRMCKKEEPVLKRHVIWLDKHLFKLDAGAWRALIAAHGGDGLD